MMTRSSRLLACAMLTVPGAGLAQDFTGAATLGYAYSSVSGFRPNVNGFSLDGAGTFAFQSGFSLDVDGSLLHANPDRGGNAGVFDVGGQLNYRFLSGPLVGAYLEYASLDSNGLLGSDINATSYGVTGGYEGSLLQATAFFGGTDASTMLGASSDWTDYGVNVAYTPTQYTKFAGHWMRSDIDTIFAETKVTSIGVGGDHDFGAGFTGFGAISHLNFDARNIDATSYGFGVGYDLSQIARVPAQVSLELARTKIDPVGPDTDVDTIRFGVTIPLGARSGGAPLNSAASSAMSPRHNALSTFYDNLY
ncbi:hypothetical protein [Roseovarius sp. Pro17]|uniref:hypothetical protein n=1 Tax=Roseovarius sp. Pro17 TaxID=3108175 RepID=UPI002D76609E|nr:hypothetical protein [Roseovarius sp. Pro17]